MKHRIEIDGLRAFAILPVLFFHAGFTWFQGGFFGVDIFFVISGFLITGIIVNELNTKNSFSIANFYERRARRIMPALIVVILASLPLAWFTLFPTEFKNFFESIGSIMYFGSNYYFLGKTGYFDPNIDLNPMLHTWSLAIEEQFYLVFPLLLWLLSKVLKQKYWIPLLAVAASISLVLANSQWSIDPNSDFYLVQYRAWELMVGAIAAIYLSRQDTNGYSKQIPSILGLLMILYSVFFVNSTFAHPGYITLLPVLGTALVILYAGKGTIVHKILSWRVFVFVGLISYSTYLWHQPLFAFFRTSQPHEPIDWQFLPLITLSLLLAYLTWRFIENPFRNRKFLSRRKILLGTATVAILAIVGANFVASRWGINNYRYSIAGQSFVALEKRIKTNKGLDASCGTFNDSNPKCQSGPNPTVLLWGDSYAMHLADALKASTTKADFVQQGLSACAPILGLAHQNEVYGQKDGRECIQHNDKVFAWLKTKREIKTVVLASPWSDGLQTQRKSMDRSGAVFTNGERAVDELRATIRGIRALGKNVVIVGPTPNNGQDLGQCLTRSAANGQALSGCDYKLVENTRTEIYLILSQLRSDAPVVSLVPLICQTSICQASIGDTFMYRDAGHLTHEGSTYLGKTYDLMGMILRANEPAKTFAIEATNG